MPWFLFAVPVASGAGDLCIGKQPIPDNFWFAPGEFFIGKIDEVRIQKI